METEDTFVKNSSSVILPSHTCILSPIVWEKGIAVIRIEAGFLTQLFSLSPAPRIPLEAFYRQFTEGRIEGLQMSSFLSTPGVRHRRLACVNSDVILLCFDVRGKQSVVLASTRTRPPKKVFIGRLGEGLVSTCTPFTTSDFCERTKVEEVDPHLLTSVTFAQVED
ncbi:hypothetical protein CEXT_252511 [Caerostris extrusa]|uniref:Uncharacterized protein n=1 Tax=Caerostris extrusa TaxID=172846 RepID=A0AAV4MYD8_CAEEX|nr:hypothetical protein CEXT_252511 [Caerostris extrusa]